MPFFKVTFCVAVALMFSACSTVMTGTTQKMEVITPYAPGASCTIKDKKNQWLISSTPGSAKVRKSRRPLVITCLKNGYKSGKAKAHSRFAKATLGNILVGGIIGSAIDRESGASRNYPSTVLVWLEPSEFSSPQSRKMWLAEKEKYEEPVDNKTKKKPEKIIW